MMSLTIDLAPGEEQYLVEQAAQQGLPVSDYVRRLLQSNLESAAREAKAQRAQSVLQSWIDEARSGSSEEALSEEAQREALYEAQQWEEAARSVDEDRLSYRRRFPNLAPDAAPGTSP
jgi:hypothetical protein